MCRGHVLVLCLQASECAVSFRPSTESGQQASLVAVPSLAVIRKMSILTSLASVSDPAPSAVWRSSVPATDPGLPQAPKQ